MKAPQTVPIQTQILSQTDRVGVSFHAVNEGANALGAKQAFLFRKRFGRVFATHGMHQPQLNRDSPLIALIEKTVDRETRKHPGARAIRFQIPQGGKVLLSDGLALIWADGRGLILLRERKWADPEVAQALQLSDLYAVKYDALSRKRRRASVVFRRIVWSLLLIAVLASLVFIKVPLRVVAPARVLAAEPLIVTSPSDGRITDVLVASSARVAAGDVMITFDTRDLESELRSTQQNEVITERKLQQARTSALVNQAARAEVATLEAELALAVIQREWAQNRLERQQVIAPQAGQVNITAPDEMIGAVVAAGDPLLEIVEPSRVRVQIDVPVADSIFLYDLTQAQLFLNHETLVERRLTTPDIPFQPQLDARGGVSYPLRMELDGADLPIPPIGSEGFVRLLGDDASLGYVLLRRPINWLLVRLRP